MRVRSAELGFFWTKCGRLVRPAVLEIPTEIGTDAANSTGLSTRSTARHVGVTCRRCDLRRMADYQAMGIRSAPGFPYRY